MDNHLTKWVIWDRRLTYAMMDACECDAAVSDNGTGVAAHRRNIKSIRPYEDGYIWKTVTEIAGPYVPDVETAAPVDLPTRFQSLQSAPMESAHSNADVMPMRQPVMQPLPAPRWTAVPMPQPPPPPTPIPPEKWPRWAKLLAKLRTPEDTGLGDTLARKIPAGDAFKKYYKKIMGSDCGCANRQAKMNAVYPYSTL